MLANTKRVISWLLVLAVEVSLPVPSHIGWAGGLGDGDCYLMEGSLAARLPPSFLSLAGSGYCNQWKAVRINQLPVSCRWLAGFIHKWYAWQLLDSSSMCTCSCEILYALILSDEGNCAFPAAQQLIESTTEGPRISKCLLSAY